MIDVSRSSTGIYSLLDINSLTTDDSISCHRIQSTFIMTAKHSEFNVFHWMVLIMLNLPPNWVRADSRFAPSQWERLQSNAISHWLGACLESPCEFSPGVGWCNLAAVVFPCNYGNYQPESCFNIKIVFPGIRIPIVQVRWSHNRLIFMKGFLYW